MGSLGNSDDPDEMQRYAAIHQGLHCLLRLKQPSGTDIHNNLENFTCVPLKYMSSPYLLYQHVLEIPSEYKGLKGVCNVLCFVVHYFVSILALQSS